ncbi:hypothetical protein [Arsenicibacter rosenii]|uniref:Uncharacterized protein n=1 Tax=Arsenicibacter rosenii TaxID=1750698 RepID=A0A1S2VBR9_9BACT|nr:hypothetical protein [Arsenicibacter rosenii]OIN55755.1 hypothetical protein BLX24_28480 [Arsenicibacter rosenii]
MKSANIPGPADLERLAAEYDEMNLSDDGYATALAGGDDPKALRLAPGDEYHTVAYSETRGFHWQRHIVEAEAGESFARSQSMQDLIDFGGYERY